MSRKEKRIAGLAIGTISLGLSFLLLRRLTNSRAKVLKPTPLPQDTSKMTMTDVEDAVERSFEEVLRPLDALRLFVPRCTTKHAPMVLMLGNHSSGKSTLINFLLGPSCNQAQATGVAPTDDGFTVLLRGDRDMDEDGPTAVSNPKYGFEELRGFGHEMFAHLKVKTRLLDGATTDIPKDLMLIDSPGMIDSPNRTGGMEPASGRGYDFLNVVKWFATRSDIVLLMFDPNNPGTTGETLDVLTRSLRGLEHKFIIVFNKCDVFDKVPDFARCYGALCWNLSKVIDRKDLPRIYTMFTETSENKARTTNAVMCSDFRDMRQEVIGDILQAPSRRIDNTITELDSACRHLHMCLTIVNILKQSARRKKRRRTVGVVGALLGVTGTGLAVAFRSKLDFTRFSLYAAGSVALSALFSTYTMLSRHRFEENMKEVDTVFEVEYHDALQSEQCADIRNCFDSVKSKLRHVLRNRIRTIDDVPSTHPEDLRLLETILSINVPVLRLAAHQRKLELQKKSQQ